MHCSYQRIIGTAYKPLKFVVEPGGLILASLSRDTGSDRPPVPETTLLGPDAVNCGHLPAHCLHWE